MSRRAALFVATLVVLTIVNFLWPAAPSPLTSSTFGKAGSGHGAAYELLQEAGLARGRSFESARRLDDDGTLWWIDPLGVCDGRIASTGEVDVLDAEQVQWPAADWIRAGGVAVVLLQSADPGGPVLPPQDGLVVCDAIGGVSLPRRERLALPSAAEAAEAAETPGSWVVEGPLAGSPRRLAQSKLYGFEESLDWQVSARVRAGAQADPDEALPFALERAFGAGRLVVLADSGFTHNAWLDRADAAPLLLDLVRDFGPPRFDERDHGFVPETSALRYLAGSPARPVFLGLLLLGVLYAWRGNALPSRSVSEFDPASPTLDTYVGSMAGLYAGTRDHARVLERYCELTASRLRRHFGLPQELSRRVLVERIESDPRSVRETRSDPAAGARLHEKLARLVDPPGVSTAAELEAAVRELDSIVREVTR